MRNLNVAKTSTRIEKWIMDFVKESKTTGVVLGISGGIDSALTGELAVRALGPSSVYGMILDCESRPDDVVDGLLVAKHLGVKHDRYDLAPALLAVEHALSRDSVIHHQLARANLKSRLRMCALYAKANETNRLVIGTTNLTEAVLGYYTKYGDGGIDLEPIIGLLKREVREMAAFLGIPEEIVNRVPTAGLWNGQTDEDELGYAYDELDAVVEVENQTEDTPIQNLVWGRYRASEHKRKMPPGFTDIVLE
jgi:NAD+ synthase